MTGKHSVKWKTLCQCSLLKVITECNCTNVCSRTPWAASHRGRVTWTVHSECQCAAVNANREVSPRGHLTQSWRDEPKNSRGHGVGHVHTDVGWSQPRGRAGNSQVDAGVWRTWGRGTPSFGKPLSLCSTQTSTEQRCTLLGGQGTGSSPHSPALATFIEGSSWRTSALLGENTLNNPWDAGPCRLLTPLGSWLCATVSVHTPEECVLSQLPIIAGEEDHLVQQRSQGQLDALFSEFLKLSVWEKRTRQFYFCLSQVRKTFCKRSCACTRKAGWGPTCFNYFNKKTHQINRCVSMLSMTLCDPMNCSLSSSSVHGILQARILEWVAMPSPSRGSSQPREWTPALSGGFFTTAPPGKPLPPPTGTNC